MPARTLSDTRLPASGASLSSDADGPALEPTCRARSTSGRDAVQARRRGRRSTRTPARRVARPLTPAAMASPQPERLHPRASSRRRSAAPDIRTRQRRRNRRPAAAASDAAAAAGRRRPRLRSVPSPRQEIHSRARELNGRSSLTRSLRTPLKGSRGAMFGIRLRRAIQHRFEKRRHGEGFIPGGLHACAERRHLARFQLAERLLPDIASLRDAVEAQALQRQAGRPAPIVVTGQTVMDESLVGGHRRGGNRLAGGAGRRRTKDHRSQGKPQPATRGRAVTAAFYARPSHSVTIPGGRLFKTLVPDVITTNASFS
jgi:hypothetical protein